MNPKQEHISPAAKGLPHAEKPSARSAGVTQAKPPLSWWNAMCYRVRLQHPSWTAEYVGRVVGNIWWHQYSQAMRDAIVSEYADTPASPLGVKIPCPGCMTLISVPHASLFVKCSKCGADLVRVHIGEANGRRSLLHR